VARHPRAALGAGLSGALTIIGLSGLPDDLENWNAAFQAIGSDLGRWLLVGVGVCVALALIASRKQQSESPAKKPDGLGPMERREHIDNLLYPPRDDRLELGEQCANFATKMHVFNEEQEWRRERTISRFAEETREADPDLEPQQARARAEAIFEREVKAAYGFEMREEALRLFDEAREKDAIAAKMRRMVEEPRPAEMSEIPHLFAAMARRLNYEPIVDYASALGPPPEDLKGLVDALMREGINLVDELSAPAEPKRTDSGWRLDGGGAPDEWWDKADDFAKRIRQLLIDRHPALLTDYRDGYNAHVRKERKERKEDDSAQDTRSTAEKMLDFANFERSGPRRVVEASLEGLAAARHRLGPEQSQKSI
jgi:hypothetical protein